MKLIDVKSNSYVEFNIDSNEKDPEFKVRDHVKISKYKKTFVEEDLSEEDFVISKIKNTAPQTYQWFKW